MALDHAHGAIQWALADTVGTTKTVTGLAFQPKALRFYIMGLGSATDTASETQTYTERCVGFATSTSDRRMVASTDQDAAASMSCVAGYRTDRVAAAEYGAGSLDLDAITSDGFRLIVD